MEVNSRNPIPNLPIPEDIEEKPENSVVIFGLKKSDTPKKSIWGKLTGNIFWFSTPSPSNTNQKLTTEKFPSHEIEYITSSAATNLSSLIKKATQSTGNVFVSYLSENPEEIATILNNTLQNIFYKRLEISEKRLYKDFDLKKGEVEFSSELVIRMAILDLVSDVNIGIKKNDHQMSSSEEGLLEKVKNNPSSILDMQKSQVEPIAYAIGEFLSNEVDENLLLSGPLNWIKPHLKAWLKEVIKNKIIELHGVYISKRNLGEKNSKEPDFYRDVSEEISKLILRKASEIREPSSKDYPTVDSAIQSINQNLHRSESLRPFTNMASSLIATSVFDAIKDLHKNFGISATLKKLVQSNNAVFKPFLEESGPKPDLVAEQVLNAYKEMYPNSPMKVDVKKISGYLAQNSEMVKRTLIEKNNDRASFDKKDLQHFVELCQLSRKEEDPYWITDICTKLIQVGPKYFLRLQKEAEKVLLNGSKYQKIDGLLLHVREASQSILNQMKDLRNAYKPMVTSKGESFPLFDSNSLQASDFAPKEQDVTKVMEILDKTFTVKNIKTVSFENDEIAKVIMRLLMNNDHLMTADYKVSLKRQISGVILRYVIEKSLEIDLIVSDLINIGYIDNYELLKNVLVKRNVDGMLKSVDESLDFEKACQELHANLAKEIKSEFTVNESVWSADFEYKLTRKVIVDFLHKNVKLFSFAEDLLKNTSISSKDKLPVPSFLQDKVWELLLKKCFEVYTDFYSDLRKIQKDWDQANDRIRTYTQNIEKELKKEDAEFFIGIAEFSAKSLHKQITKETKNLGLSEKSVNPSEKRNTIRSLVENISKGSLRVVLCDEALDQVSEEIATFLCLESTDEFFKHSEFEKQIHSVILKYVYLTVATFKKDPITQVITKLMKTVNSRFSKEITYPDKELSLTEFFQSNKEALKTGTYKPRVIKTEIPLREGLSKEAKQIRQHRKEFLSSLTRIDQIANESHDDWKESIKNLVKQNVFRKEDVEREIEGVNRSRIHLLEDLNKQLKDVQTKFREDRNRITTYTDNTIDSLNYEWGEEEFNESSNKIHIEIKTFLKGTQDKEFVKAFEKHLGSMTRLHNYRKHLTNKLKDFGKINQKKTYDLDLDRGLGREYRNQSIVAFAKAMRKRDDRLEDVIGDCLKVVQIKQENIPYVPDDYKENAFKSLIEGLSRTIQEQFGVHFAALESSFGKIEKGNSAHNEKELKGLQKAASNIANVAVYSILPKLVVENHIADDFLEKILKDSGVTDEKLIKHAITKAKDVLLNLKNEKSELLETFEWVLNQVLQNIFENVKEEYGNKTNWVSKLLIKMIDEIPSEMMQLQETIETSHPELHELLQIPPDKRTKEQKLQLSRQPVPMKAAEISRKILDQFGYPDKESLKVDSLYKDKLWELLISTINSQVLDNYTMIVRAARQWDTYKKSVKEVKGKIKNDYSPEDSDAITDMIAWTASEIQDSIVEELKKRSQLKVKESKNGNNVDWTEDVILTATKKLTKTKEKSNKIAINLSEETIKAISGELKSFIKNKSLHDIVKSKSCHDAIQGILFERIRYILDKNSGSNIPHPFGVLVGSFFHSIHDLSAIVTILAKGNDNNEQLHKLHLNRVLTNLLESMAIGNGSIPVVPKEFQGTVWNTALSSSTDTIAPYTNVMIQTIRHIFSDKEQFIQKQDGLSKKCEELADLITNVAIPSKVLGEKEIPIDPANDDEDRKPGLIESLLEKKLKEKGMDIKTRRWIAEGVRSALYTSKKEEHRMWEDLENHLTTFLQYSAGKLLENGGSHLVQNDPNFLKKIATRLTPEILGFFKSNGPISSNQSVDWDTYTSSLGEKVLGLMYPDKKGFPIPDNDQLKFKDQEGQDISLKEFVWTSLSDTISDTIKDVLAPIGDKAKRNQFVANMIGDTIVETTKEMGGKAKRGQYINTDSNMLKDDASQLLRKNIKAVVNVNIKYAIHKSWLKMHTAFDRILHKLGGKYAVKFKHVLDKIFRFVFITVTGTLLYYLLFPLIWPINKVWDMQLERIAKNIESILSRDDYTVLAQKLIDDAFSMYKNGVDTDADSKTTKDELLDLVDHLSNLIVKGTFASPLKSLFPFSKKVSKTIDEKLTKFTDMKGDTPAEFAFSQAINGIKA